MRAARLRRTPIACRTPLLCFLVGAGARHEPRHAAKQTCESPGRGLCGAHDVRRCSPSKIRVRWSCPRRRRQMRAGPPSRRRAPHRGTAGRPDRRRRVEPGGVRMLRRQEGTPDARLARVGERRGTSTARLSHRILPLVWNPNTEQPKPLPVERDNGFNESHGYAPGHGGPSGPGDVPSPPQSSPLLPEDHDEKPASHRRARASAEEEGSNDGAAAPKGRPRHARLRRSRPSRFPA